MGKKLKEFLVDIGEGIIEIIVLIAELIDIDY